MAYFTFTLNGHEYTSDPANNTAADGYRFIGYGYIPALGNLAIDLVALATGVGVNAEAVDEATEIAVTAAGEADEARDAAVAAAAAATSAARGLQGTSATALTPGVGNRVFVTQAGKQFPLNHNIVAVSASDPNVFIYGTVGAYAGTGLTINCTVPGTATEKADWVIAVSGVRGLQGIQGPPGDDAEVGSPTQTRAVNGTITRADLGAVLICTAPITLAPDSAATLQSDFSTIIKADGGAVTITGVGTVFANTSMILHSTGAAYKTTVLSNAVEELVSVTDAAGAASVDFTGLDPAYDYFISGQAIVPGANAGYLRARVSSDNGATWKSSGSYNNISMYFQAGSVASSVGTTGTELSLTDFTTDTTNAALCHELQLELRNIGSTTKHKFIEGIAKTVIAGSALSCWHSIGRWLGDTDAINGFRIFHSTSTLTGKFILTRKRRA